MQKKPKQQTPTNKQKNTTKNPHTHSQQKHFASNDKNNQLFTVSVMLKYFTKANCSQSNVSYFGNT